jgi:hypothetical protein
VSHDRVVGKTLSALRYSELVPPSRWVFPSDMPPAKGDSHTVTVGAPLIVPRRPERRRLIPSDAAQFHITVQNHQPEMAGLVCSDAGLSRHHATEQLLCGNSVFK